MSTFKQAMFIGLCSVAALPLYSSAQYPESRENRHERCEECGTVRDVQREKARDEHLGAGTAIGAVAGAVVGSTIGKGDGRKAAEVGGAIAGGAIGHNIEKNDRQSDEQIKYRISMDDGRSVTIVQADDQDLHPGDRVIIRDGRVDRFN